jgi:hypothetical protein
MSKLSALLGNPEIVRDFCWLVKDKRPSMVFLIETKLRSKKMERIRQRTNFNNVFVVESVGRSRGLALLWSEGDEVVIQNYSCRHINARVKLDSN